MDSILPQMRSGSPRVIIDPGEEVVLEERVGADLLTPRAERPRRRLREKTAMSTMVVEREKVEDQAHFEKWHQHVTQWVKEELEILDAEGEDQEMWLGVLREGLRRRSHIEAALRWRAQQKQKRSGL